MARLKRAGTRKDGPAERSEVSTRGPRAPTVVVIGASAGGLAPLLTLVGSFPEDLPAAVFIVVHIGANKSELPVLFTRTGRLRALHPRDGEPVRSGRIYVAPPDHHMVLRSGRVHLSRGPRENWARPAIDPLFRSAAEAYGPQAIGVILSGGLNDGTAGLHEIAERGGTTVVQDPNDAVDPSMPRSALANVAVDHCVPIADMPHLLLELVAAKAAEVSTQPQRAVATRQEEAMTEFTLDRPVAITCPDCGGALRRQDRGRLTQFRCHIGHVYTAEVTLAAQFVAMERSLESALRSLSERAELCRQMADKAGNDDDGTQAGWEAAMREALDRTEVMRQLLERDWIHPEEGSVVEAAGE